VDVPFTNRGLQGYEMKTPMIALFLLSTWMSAQESRFLVTKTSVPCTNAMTDTFKGKWIDNKSNTDFGGLNHQQSAEVLTRVNAIQQLVMAVYPSPVGAWAAWNAALVKTSFADQVKYEMNQNNTINEEKIKTNPVSRLQYSLILSPFSCHGEDEIWNIYPNITGNTGLTIHANYLPILNAQVLDNEEGMTIDGRPIKYKMPTMGAWKGYEMMTPEGGSNALLFNSRYVLISRKGMLPYVPVTRKQYLDRAIKYISNKYDKWIAISAEIPDRDEREKEISDTKQQKAETLLQYQEELKRTTSEGKLDSAAIVAGVTIMGPAPKSIFSTEAEGGRMLVTENPDYFRKELPNYVPQFFVLEWDWANAAWSLNFRQAIEDNFQIGNLLEMIDK
jgi:hypothetical protein